jgi:hypothetical protein
MRSRGVSYAVIGRVLGGRSNEWARIWTNEEFRERRHAYEKARYAAKKAARQ